MPGLGGVTLGASGALAPLPSPTAGVGGQNPFMQLATAAAQIPAAEAEVKKKKQEAELLKTQTSQAKMQAAQTRINMLAPLAKSNPYNQEVVHALSTAYKDLGLPAPVVEGGMPVQSPSAGTSAGGSGTPGSPAQVGQQPAGQQGPPAPVSAQQQQVGPSAPMVDVNALFPHASITDMFDKNPEFLKVWNAMKPSQRAAIGPQFGLTPGSPGYDALVNAQVTKTAAEQNVDIQAYRSIWQQFGKGDVSLATAQAFTNSFAPRLKEDGIDISQIITPDEKMQIGAVEQAKIGLYQKVGMMDAAKGKAALMDAQTKIENLGSETSLRSAQANLANTRAALLPEQVQSQIQLRIAAADHAAQRIGMARQKYQDASSKSSPLALNKERSALAGEATNLRGQIATLTGVGKTLLANNPNAPDPGGSGKTYAQVIAEQLAQLNPQLDAVTQDMRDADSTARAVRERALQAAIGSDGTSRVLPQSPPSTNKTIAGHMPDGRAVFKSGNAYVFADGSPAR
jgi:hypothetical protein